MMARRRLFFWALLLSLAILGSLTFVRSCEYARPTLNAPLKQWDPKYGYQFSNLAPPDEGNSDTLFILTAFSGGGTRASTLAYGALKELAQQRITWEGRDKRLLDEVDAIWALSGGTFTGAYYALFGDRIFHEFESRFLRKDWESELKARILRSPSSWLRLLSPHYGRAHILADLLDEALFEGKTYGDLLQKRSRPGLLIHASDMATLARFEFQQQQFDRMCSDLSQLPIARAATASAALPLVLSPITLKSYAGTCGYEPPEWLLRASRSSIPPARQRAKEMLSYLDPDKRPYIHLLDGGLSDNLALRTILEGVDLRRESEQPSALRALETTLKHQGVTQVKKLVILSVNAETSPDVKEYRTDEIPTLTRALSALVDIPINRYSTDTLLILRFAVETWRKELRSRPPGIGNTLTPDAEVYFIDASLGAVDDTAEQEYLMRIPTTLYLTDEQITRLLGASSRLITGNPDFQRLMQDIGTKK